MQLFRAGVGERGAGEDSVQRIVVALRDRIVAAVEKKFGIRLEPEPVLLGSESGA